MLTQTRDVMWTCNPIEMIDQVWHMKGEKRGNLVSLIAQSTPSHLETLGTEDDSIALSSGY